MSYYTYISVEDLNIDDLKKLAAIKHRKDITQFEITEQFEDDHSYCCNVIINNIEVPIYYQDCINWLNNWQTSSSAFRRLKGTLNELIDNHEYMASGGGYDPNLKF